jgi:DNA-binding response OmpR family regulator
MSSAPSSDLASFESCGRKIRPLLISNDATLTAFAAVHLASDAYEVATASSTPEGWEKLSAEAFGVVIIDLALPDSAGFKLLERIRADSLVSGVPVIVCSDREDTTEVERAFDAGATSFFTKPVNWRLLSYQVRFAWRAHHVEVARCEAELDAMTRKIMSESASLLSEAMHGGETLRTKAREYATALGALAKHRPAYG